MASGRRPEQPSRDRAPSRDEIELPARGPLRDRYVLRLIAIDPAIHVIVLSTLAVVLFTFAGHDASLHRDYLNIMNDLWKRTRGGRAARRPRVLAEGVRLLASTSHPSRAGGHRLRSSGGDGDGRALVRQALG